MAWWSRHWKALALVGLGYVLRIVCLGCQSLWRDEVDAVRFATFPLGDLLRFFSTPGQNGPLYYLLLRPWLNLVGKGEFALRYLSLACGVLALPLIYRVARRLASSRGLHPGAKWEGYGPLVALLLAATSPYLVWYSQEGKMYALALVLVLLSMERYLAALRGGGKGCWLPYTLATSAAFYVHLFTALIVPVQALILFVSGAQVRKAAWRPWLLSLLAMSLPYFPLFVWQAPLLLKPAETGYGFVPLHEMLYSLLATFSLGVVQAPGLWAIVPFLAVLFAVGYFWPSRVYRLDSVGIVVIWLLIPVLILFLVTLIRPLYTARYLIFILPAYLLLLAMGLVGIGRRTSTLAGGLLLVLLVVQGRGVVLQARVPVKADFRAATQYVSSRLQPQDLVLFQIPYGKHSFDYYLTLPPGEAEESGPIFGGHRVYLPLLEVGDHSPYRWAEGLYTNSGMDPTEVDRLMAGMVAGSGRVWLVASEVTMWDQRGLVQAWLDEHMGLSRTASFVKVTVKLYELR